MVVAEEKAKEAQVGQYLGLDSVTQRHFAIKEPRMRSILRIQDEVLASIRDYLRKRGFLEILPPIIGPVTDPGIRGAKQVSIDYYGAPFKVMSSMILYKQMAITCVDKMFSVSPNVRLEPLATVETRRHLTEFRQVDLEEAYATYEDSMKLAEGLLRHVCIEVKKKRGKELEELGRELKVPKLPFPRITHREAIDICRSLGFKVSYEEEVPWEAEEAISREFQEPFFIMDYAKESRGFYYPEHKDKPGLLRDFDLLYPEGFGEAISGGEREQRYEKVIERMRATGDDPEKYGWYLELLKKGVPPSSGFGIGVERLTRYLCGLESVWEAVPFPKVAGVISP